MRKPKKPSLKRRPKLPKAGASLDVHKRWEQRAKRVADENRKKMQAYNKALKAYENAQKTKRNIRQKYSSARPY